MVLLKVQNSVPLWVQEDLGESQYACGILYSCHFGTQLKVARQHCSTVVYNEYAMHLPCIVSFHHMNKNLKIADFKHTQVADRHSS